jgi:DNA-binding transcriptional MerR regulator
MAQDERDVGPGYPIRLVSELTGLGIETLRQWERRYGFPTPARSSTGVRAYDAETVDILKMIARAIAHGYRPGELVGKPREEIERALGSLPGGELPERSGTVEEVLDALSNDDADAVTSLLRRAAILLGPRRFVTEVAEHLVYKVGELWAAGRLEVRQEHLLSDLLTTQLRVLRAAFEEVRRAPVAVLATLSGESHALGMEMVAVYLATRRVTARVLGPDTPPEEIAQGARALRGDVVCLSISESAPIAAARSGVRTTLDALPPRVELWAGGQGARSLNVDHPALRIITSWDDLDRNIDRL